MTKPIIAFKVGRTEYGASLGPEYEIHDLLEPGAGPDVPALRGCRVLVTSGSAGVTRQEMAALPSLQLICCLGTGYEGVDLDAARERGITVTHGAGTNAVAVADHAMALLLALMRDIPRLDGVARRGGWRDGRGPAPRPIPTGKRLGLIGMGGVGMRVARRAEGFEMTIAYHARMAKPDLPWRHVASPRQLAAEVDCLVVAVPGGPATFHMVDGPVLAALGPAGFLVNVGRGSVVDTEALVEALTSGGIAGAALDVFENEPLIPPALRACPNAVLTPHVAGGAPEVRDATLALLRSNIGDFLNGRQVLTPVPGMAAP